jgi:hypothetical protein
MIIKCAFETFIKDVGINNFTNMISFHGIVIKRIASAILSTNKKSSLPLL